MTTSPATIAPIDGRRARGQRSKDAIVDALLELLRDGQRQPSTEDIARRAGVT